ncbi:MAG: hypothetical protein LBO06_00505 [Bacteroidales bacterium]|nr:hypothetical protein [Bacteroidales bacterium]
MKQYIIKFKLYLIVILMSAAFCTTSCSSEDSCGCYDDTPWSDQHGTCYSSNYYCHQGGYNCIKCWHD